MYGKLFESMYDGTLVENWEALITFQQMIILCNSVGIIDITPRALSSRTGIPLEIIERGIEMLEKEDPYSRTNHMNGIRIERLDGHRPWGWSIVNHAKYKKLQLHEDKKKSDRERIQAKRDAKKANKIKDVANSRKVSQIVESVADVAYTDTDTDTDNLKTFCPNSDELRLASLLFSLILERNPGHKKPKLQSWAKSFDLLLRVDKRELLEVENLLRWCQSDPFWQNNILSPDKFRKQYDQLRIKKNGNGTGPKEGDTRYHQRINEIFKDGKWIRDKWAITA